MPVARSKPVILALDLGSSRLKARVFSGQPGLLRTVSRAAPVMHSGQGRATIEPSRWLRSVFCLLDEAHSMLNAPVAAVAVTGAWHSLVGLDAGGKPVTTAYTWDDATSQPAVESLRNTLEPAAYHQRTGAFIHASFWPAKLALLSAGVASGWRGLPEWLIATLTGIDAMSPSMAGGTGLYNLSTGKWDGETLASVGLRESQLACIQSAPTDPLIDPWAERWPMLAGAPWCLPLGDGATGTVGTVPVGAIAVNAGPSGAVRVQSLELPAHVPAALFCYPVDDGAGVVLGAALSNAGNAWWWLNDVLGGVVAPEAGLTTRVRFKVDLAPRRYPFWDGHMGGSLSGLDLATTREEIAAAVLDGLALEFATAIKSVSQAGLASLDLAVVSGGLSSSPAFLQRVATQVDVRVTASSQVDGSLIGAADLAARRLGLNLPPTT